MNQIQFVMKRYKEDENYIRNLVAVAESEEFEQIIMDCAKCKGIRKKNEYLAGAKDGFSVAIAMIYDWK